jgi:ATP-dependent helicase/nuclease subunit A
VPPAELFDLVLRESAYWYEIRGARYGQARENLKKLRVLLRRLQNRGYLTLSRLVSHLDRLSVGDESNAAIDAADAVNLMTIHAAKGLEFPVVFIVNLSRGTGNRRPPIRVAVTAGSEDAHVSVGDFQSEADEDRQQKEREESKRLLYVAVTRARDRLYLSSLVKEGLVPRSPGSLAEVLPHSLLDCLAGAARADEVVTWRASSGAAHLFAVCGSPQVQPSGAADRLVLGVPADSADDDIEPVHCEPDYRTVAETLAHDAEAAVTGGRASDALLGTVVHRLLQRLGLQQGLDSGLVVEMAQRVVTSTDDVAADEMAAVTERAAALYGALVQRPEVAAVYAAAAVFHEVPFARVDGDRVVRGVIDCVAQIGQGRLTVLEFKTGRPQQWHREQLEAYRRAVGAVFPTAEVRGQLVYSDPSWRS